MSTTRRIFPEAFKREAVDRVTSSGLSVDKIATELGLHETVLRRWVKQFSAQATGPVRRPITQAPAPSPSDLVSEVSRLRRENELTSGLRAEINGALEAASLKNSRGGLGAAA
jgi:transposase